MKRKIVGKMAAIAVALAAGTMLTAAGKPQPAARTAAQPNWNATVSRTPEGGFLLGNPAAGVKLVEFVSYTCPHCAHFEKEAADQLRIGFVQQGKGSVEIRPFVRDPVDMAAALLTHCGPQNRFFLRHTMFMRQQDKWLQPLANSSPAQRQRWFSGDLPTRMRNIANDFGFYPMMRTLGVERPVAERCLGNTALAARLASQTQDAQTQLSIEGTPSFMVNGIVLAGTHDWRSLRPQLEARLR